MFKLTYQSEREDCESYLGFLVSRLQNQSVLACKINMTINAIMCRKVSPRSHTRGTLCDRTLHNDDLHGGKTAIIFIDFCRTDSHVPRARVYICMCMRDGIL